MLALLFALVKNAECSRTADKLVLKLQLYQPMGLSVWLRASRPFDTKSGVCFAESDSGDCVGKCVDNNMITIAVAVA
jgi:hypothetical protein